MLNSTNPFSDPEWSKAILHDEGIEPAEEDTEEIDIRSIIPSAPVLPTSAKNLIMDASALAKNEKEQKAKEMTYALSEVFTKYNETYGTDLSIDFNNLSNTLVNVSNPETRKTLELYVSEVFKSVRPILLLHLIQKLTLAMDYVLQPERMFDQNSMSTADLFIVVEKLMQYVDQLNTMMDEVTIKDSDKLLEKLASDRQDKNLNSDESKKAVDEFMKLFRNEQNKKNE